MLFAAAVAMTMVGCEGSGGPAADGTERGACYGNGTCNDGLTCLSDRCVRPAGADCDAVAEALTSIDLGNYAPKDQRAGRVMALAAICRTQHLTEDDGQCILDARTKADLASCKKPLIVDSIAELGDRPTRGLPAACTDYLRALERYATCPSLGADAQRAIRQTVRDMKVAWAQSMGSGGPTPPGVETACTNGVVAMKQALAQMGCP
jgi:hypothetical protein